VWQDEDLKAGSGRKDGMLQGQDRKRMEERAIFCPESV
jgi:hypothetical protein